MRTLVKCIIMGMLAGSLTSLFTACSEEPDCSANARAMINCNLFTHNELTGALQRDTLDSLTITAFSTDSIILNRGEEVTALILPLRYTADSTVLVFHYTGRTTDTVTLHHTNTPYFLSMDCGYQMQQALTGVSYSRHKLDSIHITNSEAGIYGTENLQLFY